MKVRELLDVLSDAEPDDVVVFDLSSDFLVRISIRPGMHQIVEDSTALAVGEEEFLREMHIRW